jgi:hypothetical protein
MCKSESVLSSLFIAADRKERLYKEVTCHWKEKVMLELWAGAIKRQNGRLVATRREAMPLSHFTRAISCVIFYTTTKLSFVLTFPN